MEPALSNGMYKTIKLADLMLPRKEDMMTREERMAQFNTDWDKAEERLRREQLRAFELIQRYLEGNRPPDPDFDTMDDGESIPLVKAWGNWRAGE